MQPATHAGSMQCMHCCFTYENSFASVGLYSLMMFLVNELRSRGARWMPSSRVSGGSLLASAQATTQDWQPMQRVASYSIATAAAGAVAPSSAASALGLRVATETTPAAATVAVPVASFRSASRRVISMASLPPGWCPFLSWSPAPEEAEDCCSRAFAMPYKL